MRRGQSPIVDPSGGSNDAMTLAIGHADGDGVILDLIRERKPPFYPEAVVIDFCQVLKAYGLHEVTGDRYAGEWPRKQFRKNGVAYHVADQTRSDLYQAMLPALNSGKVTLLDSKSLVSQIANLERRVAWGGRESIDHPPNGHDDLANSVAGVIALGAKQIASAGLDLQKPLVEVEHGLNVVEPCASESEASRPECHSQAEWPLGGRKGQTLRLVERKGDCSADGGEQEVDEFVLPRSVLLVDFELALGRHHATTHRFPTAKQPLSR